MKHETDCDTITNKLMDNKESLKQIIMLPVQKFIKRHDEPSNLRKFENGSPKWKIEVMRMYSPSEQVYGL